MADIFATSWSETDSSNNNASPAGAPEGMAPSGVNDTIRANMGAIKRWYDRANPTLTAGGTANAITLTFTVAPTALNAGDLYFFKPLASNTGATTLEVKDASTSLTAKAVQLAGAALVGGEIIASRYAMVIYDGTNFQLLTFPAAVIRGTGAALNAPAGSIGEFVSSNLLQGSGVSLAVSGTVYNVTTITLSAGDWDVDGLVCFTAPGTGGTVWQGGITLNSATIPTPNPTLGAGAGPAIYLQQASIADPQRLPVPRGRLITLAASTTVYLCATMSYTGTAPVAFGYIYARRVQ